MYVVDTSAFKNDGYGEIRGFLGSKTLVYDLNEIDDYMAGRIVAALDDTYKRWQASRSDGEEEQPKKKGFFSSLIGGSANAQALKDFAYASYKYFEHNIVTSDGRFYLTKGKYKSLYQVKRK